MNNAKLCGLVLGTTVSDGIKVTEKLIIPFELVHGNLKRTIKSGDKVRMIRNHGGQEFFILEIVNE